MSALNYYALALSILHEKYPPDRALRYIAGEVDLYRKDLTEADNDDMIKLREQGLTHGEIGAMYGLSESAVFMRVKKRRRELSES
jgi:hypothetical protein